jgi:hypothetical protein
MSRLTDRLSSTRFRTETELRSILGKPILAPCPVCGSAIFAVRHIGGLLCIGCHWDDAHDRRVTAFWVTAVVRPDGTAVAVHHSEDDGYRDAPLPADLPTLAGAGLAAGGGGGGGARRLSAVRRDGSWDWDLCILAKCAFGPNPEPLAASWIPCPFCGTLTLHQSGVCYVCRRKRGL